MAVIGSDWQIPQSPSKLTDNDVHLWLAELSISPTYQETITNTLTADEKARADRFVFKKDRDHFIASRGTLRAMLGYYLNVEPAFVRFSYNSYGKPALRDQPASRKLCFNVSHSNGVALYAFAYDCEIGVDLEHIRNGMAETDIPERFFSSGEITALRKLPNEKQNEAFFNCWVRKEAYIKAKGMGLSLPLDQFEVSLANDDPKVGLEIETDSEEANRWQLYHLSPASEFTGALAVSGIERQVKAWQWKESFVSYQFKAQH